jgi:hypothetical protein
LAIRQHFSINVALGTAKPHQDPTGTARGGRSWKMASPLNSLSFNKAIILTLGFSPCNAAAMPQRSPIIFWLLLAATIALDAVVFYWVAEQPYPGPVHLLVTFHALILGQISVICIGSAVPVHPGVWRRIAPLPAALGAALVTARSIDKPVALSSSIPNHLAYFGIHTLLLLGCLWLLQRTSFWRRRTGAARTLQYSLAQLLLLMTAVAVLATTIRSSPFFAHERWINIVFLLSSVALALASVVLWSLPWHWLLRLAGVLGSAVLLDVVFLLAAASTSSEPAAPLLSLIIGSHYMIQGILLSAWLAWGPLLPGRFDPAAGS